jgi:hypothetical protein
MDQQQLFNVAFTVFSSLGGWWMKTMWDSLKELQNADRNINYEMNEIKVLVAGQYVRREEFDRMSQAIFAKLDRIEEKLDRKEDK